MIFSQFIHDHFNPGILIFENPMQGREKIATTLIKESGNYLYILFFIFLYANMLTVSKSHRYYIKHTGKRKNINDFSYARLHLFGYL